MSDRSPFLVTPEWLADRLGQPDVAIVDASWYLPAMNRDHKAEYAAGHIPGAVFFDIDAVADTSSDLPHMLPSPEVFAEWCGRHGIAETDTIVVYDGAGVFSAPRAWWTFRVMGASRVCVLDGGTPAWVAAGHALTGEVSRPQKKTFSPAFNAAKVADSARIADIAARGGASIADARPAGRFAGLDPEPRPGLRGGHMPGARSVPATSLVADGKLKSVSALRAVLESSGLDLTGPVVTTCGSGVTAAVISLALASVGHDDNALYDGSWAEWGQPGDTPVVLGMPGPAVSAFGPDRTLTARITELAATAPPVRREHVPGSGKVALMRVSEMTPAFSAWLYEQVGRPHHWFVRRNATDTVLRDQIASGTREVWVLYVGGAPAGFFELDLSGLPDVVEIALLGLMPEYHGRGLGRFLASEAMFAAFAHNPGRVTIETNTLDHPRALPLYQKLGFSPTGSRTELVEPWT